MDAIRQERAPDHGPAQVPEPSPPAVVLTDVRAWLDALTDRTLAIVDRDEHDDKDVHQMRLTTKRLRALWQMLRPVAGDQRVASQRRQLSGAARVMAADRDAFVLRQVLADLRESAPKKKQQRAIDAVCEHLPAPHGASLSPIQAYTEFLRQRVHLSFAACHETLAEVTGDDVLLEGIERTYARAQRQGLKAYFKNTARSFHRWRKWVKYLYYQLEILDPQGEEWSTTREALDQLGKVLGSCHDMANVQTFLADSTTIEDPRVLDRVARLAERAERELIRSSRPLAAKIFVLHPAEFARRLAP